VPQRRARQAPRPQAKGAARGDGKGTREGPRDGRARRSNVAQGRSVSGPGASSTSTRSPSTSNSRLRMPASTSHCATRRSPARRREVGNCAPTRHSASSSRISKVLATAASTGSGISSAPGT
jgi:hypothetical protein